MSTNQQLSTLSVTFEKDAPLSIVQFTRPERLNSFVHRQFVELTSVLAQLDTNENVSVVVLTGSGSYFSSGLDLSDPTPFDLEVLHLVNRLIDFSKPIIVAVNGPALGIAVTALALCDIVYASDTATFTTPFMKLGFCAEGCSSLLFPQIMGVSKANELLLLGKTMNALEAERANLVSEVFPANTLMDQVLKRARLMAPYSLNALKASKALLRAPMLKTLRETNEREMTCITRLTSSEETKMAMLKFVEEKKRKKSAKL